MITKIILEGPNNVGKSWLAANLKLKYPQFEIEHLSEASPNSIEFYKNLIVNEEYLILDRYALSEIVYSQLYGRPTSVSIEDIFKLVSNDNTLIIYVDADYDFIIKAYDNKNEEFDYTTVLIEKQLFYNLYNTLLENGINIIRVKNHVHPYCDVLETIYNEIERCNNV